MKAPFRIFLSAFLLVGFGYASAAPRSSSPQNRGKEESRTDYYKKWLEEDVVYIISPEEKAVFSKLTTPEEKDQFIEQFWLRRDPQPNPSSINEFKEEHYRRLQYSNERFAAGKPGWRTDRGRFYIKFGPPADIETFGGGAYARRPQEGGGMTSTHPFERWRYRHIEGIGDNIELEFVDSCLCGAYDLALDAEEKDAFLNIAGWGQTWDEMEGRLSRNDRIQYRYWGNPNNLDKAENKFAYKRLEDWFYNKFEQLMQMEKPPVLKNPKLREVVTSRLLFPETLPLKWDYTYYKLEENRYVVPLSLKVQNKELTYESTPEGNYRAKVDVYVKVTGLNERLYYEFDDSIYSYYSPSKYPSRVNQYAVYEKKLGLPPGRYKVQLLLENDEGHKNGFVSFGIIIPQFPKDPAELALSPVTVSHYLTHVIGETNHLRQFVLGNVKVVPAFDIAFRADENLAIYLQGYGVQADSATGTPDVKVLYKISNKDGKVVRELVEENSSGLLYQGSRFILTNQLPLKGLDRGKYQLNVSVVDRISGKTAVAPSADFEVSG